jgi:hypothetical protein
MARELAGNPHGTDRDSPLQIFVCGKKRMGKSEYCWRLWDSWDGDRTVIDWTADFIGAHPEPDVIELETPPPTRWPENLRHEGQRMSLRYVPNIDDPQCRKYCDDVIGMAYDHGDGLILIEEVGQVGPVGLPYPQTRKLLHHGGHKGMYVVANSPRAIGQDVLWLSQSDEVVVFRLLSARDRKRVTENVDWDPVELDGLIKGLSKGEHLRYIGSLDPPELWYCDPIPLPGKEIRRGASDALDEEEAVGA